MYSHLRLFQITVAFLSLQVASQALDADPNNPFEIVGVLATSAGEWTSIMPLACAEGCLNPASSY